MKQTATLFKIDRLNTHNGPGFRTVIYFKGCPLHCSWCHNPEGLSAKKEVWFNAPKCIGCETCVESCPEDALHMSQAGIVIDRGRCSGCQICTEVCPSKALETLGADYSLADLMKLIRQDKYLFDTTGGGVTVTGGEPGTYPDFIAELFRQCQHEGIHTAFDTSCMVNKAALLAIVPFANVVFLDIKMLDAPKLLDATGLPFEKLQKNIETLLTIQKKHSDVQIEVRTPLVPGQTDSEENLLAIGTFIQEKLPTVHNWELCMFNDLCEDKYVRMGMEWQFKGLNHSKSDYHKFNEVGMQFPSLDIAITGFVDQRKQD